MSVRILDRELEETMTEQQRNNRRRRATGPKLKYLLEEFARNPRPDKDKQFEIGRTIDMTRRSVQIWFQNHRAKHRNETKSKGRNLDFGMYRYPYGYGYNGSRFQPRITENPRWASNDFYYQSSRSTTELGASGSDLYELSCDSITLGNWHRTKPTQPGGLNLTVQCDLRNRKITYDVLYNGVCFRIAYMLENIVQASIFHDPHDHMRGYIAIEVCDPPVFWKRRACSGSDWEDCDDFTRGEAIIAKEHWLNGRVDLLTRDLKFIQSLRCQHHDMLTTADCNTNYAEEHSDSDTMWWLDEPSTEPPRPSLDRSLSTRVPVDIEQDFEPPRNSELRLSRQMSMPNLTHDHTSEFDEPQSAQSQKWTSPIDATVPDSLPSGFKLSLPPSKDLGSVPSLFDYEMRPPPPLQTKDYDLLLPLSLQSSRTDSPIQATHDRKGSPDIFARSNSMSSSVPRTPLVDSVMDRAPAFNFAELTKVSLWDEHPFDEY